jgi:pimeloyl-ACP methyl ester carboxylesterase
MPMTASRPRLYYEDHGTGEPVLLITGLGFSSRAFEPLIAATAGQPRWISYDHPATGRSSRRAFAPTTGSLAAHGARVLDHLQLSAAHIAGASLGGAVALEFALRFPERTRSLVLMSTTAAGVLARKQSPVALAALAARVASASLQRRRLWLAPAVFSRGFLDRDPAQADELLRLFSSHPPAPWGVLGQYLAAGLHNRASALHRIEAPTLIMHGGRDPLVPVANAEQLAHAISGSELHTFPWGGHAFGLECPQATVAIITDWLARRSPPP